MRGLVDQRTRRRIVRRTNKNGQEIWFSSAAGRLQRCGNLLEKRHMGPRAILFAALAAAACSAEPPVATPPAPPVAWGELPASIDGPGDEAWLTRSPDGRLILFGRHEPDYSNHHIFMTRLVDGVWSEPVEAPFTGGLEATAPHFAPDGQSVLFVASWTPDRGAREGDGNVWRVTWDGTNWGAPQILPAPINSPAAEIDAVEVNGGTIYFTSMRAGGVGPAPAHTSGNRANAAKPDMYRAVRDSAGAYRVEPLAGLNTARTESTLYVTPDESLIVFHRQEDPRGVGMDDLFAARRQGDGWGPDIHLGANANSPSFEYGPEVSADGSTLYFTTHRGEHAGVMAVNLAQAMAAAPASP
jgi:hypothetical protein